MDLITLEKFGHMRRMKKQNLLNRISRVEGKVLLGDKVGNSNDNTNTIHIPSLIRSNYEQRSAREVKSQYMGIRICIYDESY